MDEETPHIHIDFVPVITGSKRGLDTRVSLKGALAEQGFEGGTRGEMCIRDRGRTVPRKGHTQKRDVLADPLYNNKVVTKLINNIMLDLSLIHI